MELGARGPLCGTDATLQDQPIAFMDYNRAAYSRGFHPHSSVETSAVSTAPGCMITAPLCYLSGQFMDIKSFGARASPAVFPGAVHPAGPFYRPPFPDMPFTTLGSGGFQAGAPAPRDNLQTAQIAHAMTANPDQFGPPQNFPRFTGLRELRSQLDISDEAKKALPRQEVPREEDLVPHSISRSPSPEADLPTTSPGHSPPRASPPPSSPGHSADDDSPLSKKYPEYCRTLLVKDANGGTKELVFPKALDLDRPKRARTTFSAEQLYHLEREFNRNQYLVGRERTDLAQQLHLSETQVKVWFQNRRTKYKRDKQREAEERHANAESIAACNILRILQPKHPSGTASNTATPTPPKEHNPFLPPNLTAPASSMAPHSAGHLLALPRPPFYGP